MFKDSPYRRLEHVAGLAGDAPGKYIDIQVASLLFDVKIKLYRYNVTTPFTTFDETKSTKTFHLMVTTYHHWEPLLTRKQLANYVKLTDAEFEATE